MLLLNCIKLPINRIVIEEQHGFNTSRSTSTCNLVFSNFVYKSHQERLQVDVVYINFNNTFNSVKCFCNKILGKPNFGEPLDSNLTLKTGTNGLMLSVLNQMRL